MLLLMGFLRNLSDSESFQVFRALLSIVKDFNTTVVRMVSILLQIFMALEMKFMIGSDFLNILRHSIIQICAIMQYTFFL